jgi:glutamate-1-semialdehyde 2,1-aminomutase/spore coat polysaccharide biosynthesis protein SpsF
LQKVQEIARREGAVLIFDEIITGFRLALDGAQGHFGVEPDLACFGKAMANGLPLSAVVGRREIMEVFDEVFFSFTAGGEAISLVASLATIREIRDNNVIPHLWSQGRKLRDGYNVLSKHFGLETTTQCIGLSPRTILTFKDESGHDSLLLKSLFQQECLKRGILFSGGHNICFSHTDADIDRTLRVYRTALEILAQAIGEGDVSDKLEGKPMEPVFRQA